MEIGLLKMRSAHF